MAQNKNIRYLKGVGEKRAKLYEKLGITDTYGLLRHFPRSYLDFTNPFSIALAPINEACVVKGRVFAKNPEQRIRKGMTLYKVFVTDDATDLTITFFNNRFAPAALEIDGEYLFYGKLTGGITRREMTSPVFFPADAEVGLSPIYPLTEGLSSKIIANNVKQALSELDDLTPDTLPPALRKQLELCHISFALKNIHLPQSQADLDTAKRRLIFEELLILQLALFTLKSRDRAVNSHVIKNTDLSDFYKNLPFTPTNAQTRAVNEALNDMAGAKPMNRLVQGDVGSGKTMVAAALCYACAKSGVQSALMAPTEILASQHYSSLSPMLEACGIKCALLTGSCGAKKRKEIIAGLCDGSISFIVGTHALISDDVEFNNLGLVVTDEQHRFGVNQRSALGGKGKTPIRLLCRQRLFPAPWRLFFTVTLIFRF